jgi:hypothetical protein
MTDASVPDPSSPSWVNLGPFDGVIYDGTGIALSSPESGRATVVRVDPRDPNVVYLGTGGGGVWKTVDFMSGAPHWAPMTDGLDCLAIEAMDVDPTNPDTVFVALGDSFDNVAYGAVAKSVDGAKTWMSPVRLSGTYPAAAGGAPSQRRAFATCA